MEKKYFLAAISICISIISYIILMIGLITIKLQTCTITFTISAIILGVLIFTIASYFSKKIKIYNIGVFISFLLNIILLYNIFNINNEYSYIKNIVNHEYKYVTYNVYVQKKNTAYTKIEKLSGKSVGILNNQENIEEYFKKIINVTCISYKSPSELLKAVEAGEIQSFILSEEEYKNLEKEFINIKYKTHIIYSNKIKDTR